MSRFVLQARLVTVRAGSVVRDESVIDSGDDRAVLTREAVGLVARGYTAWLFRREPVPDDLIMLAPPLRLVETLSPTTPASAPSTPTTREGLRGPRRSGRSVDPRLRTPHVRVAPSGTSGTRLDRERLSPQAVAVQPPAREPRSRHHHPDSETAR